MQENQIYSLEAEQSVLGGLLLDNAQFGLVAEKITSASFYVQSHRLIFETMTKMVAERQPIDLVTLAEYAEKSGVINEIGGFAYIAEIGKNTPSCANIVAYSEIVQSRYIDRLSVNKLQGAASLIAARQKGEDFNPEKLIGGILEDIQKASASTRGKINFTMGSTGYDEIVAWQVKGYIPANSFVMLYGPSGSYKSFCAVDIACCIASGSKWNNIDVKAGAVVYIAAEGALAMRGRVRAWELRHNQVASNLAIIPKAVMVDDPDGYLSLMRTIDEVEKACEQKTALVIVDTLARCYTGNENDNSEMNKFVQAVDRLRDSTGATVMIVHHTGKDVEKGARGASALRGAVDTEIRVVRPKDTKLIYQVECTKQKDADEPPIAEFHMGVVELGVIDEDGSNRTSLAVRKVDNAPATNAFKDLIDAKNGTAKGPGAKHSEVILGLIQRKGMKDGQVFQIAPIRDDFFYANQDLAEGSKKTCWKRGLTNLINTGALVKVDDNGNYKIPEEGFEPEI